MTSLAYPPSDYRPAAWPVVDRRRSTDADAFNFIDQRRSAIEAIDPMVRRLLSRVGTPMPVLVAPVTVYEAVHPGSPETGGHWTASATLMGFLTHTIWSYAVTIEFDQQQKPARFVVSGAGTVYSDDATEGALSAALARAAVRGPLRTTAPHAFPGFAL